MGEIIFSLAVGGFLAASGIVMNVVLGREARKWKQEEDKDLSDK